MQELQFKSSLSMNEIEENFKNIDVFSGIMDGLEEALAYEKGKASRETFIRKRALPKINVSEMRKELSMTQKAFASVLGVSSRTVEAWECGKSNPTPTAKKLMYLISQDNSLVEKLLDEC
ncbi:MAG: helix-turn-helix domain-containing protein [Oscillospiraceae bacterium]|nr:helix-turn-helix domain-containing protein [Oscillospiraceae bacterium]MBQ7119575.1 helix-turn-helix domain-containing protein [Oscillospiraceae bacterium]